jgi:hypothetical protein
MKKKQNYLIRRELNEQKNLDAGFVSNRFPTVLSIVIHIIHYKKISDSVLMVRTINFFPTSYANFRIGCITKECLNGGFELHKVIAKLINTRKKSGKGKMICTNKKDALVSGHSSISYDISITYNRKKK